GGLRVGGKKKRGGGTGEKGKGERGAGFSRKRTSRGGLAKPPNPRQKNGKVLVSGNKIRIDCDSPPILLFGLLPVPIVEFGDIAQREVHFGQAGVEPNRLQSSRSGAFRSARRRNAEKRLIHESVGEARVG